MNNKWAVSILVLVIILGGYVVLQKQHVSRVSRQIKIGIVSPLSGDFAFYGESTRAGALLAQRDLGAQGMEVQLFIEDGETSPAKSLSAAQKLVEVNDVRAIYSDLNPEAVAISSYLKGKNILHVYDAASVSPLRDNPLTYKSYLDFVTGCRQAAQYLKDTGTTSVGVLQANVEFAQLCTQGIREVFDDNTFVETYDLGTTDFKTPLLKLRRHRIASIFNVSFPAETFASLKDVRAAGMREPFVATYDSISPDMIAQQPALLEGVVAFGLPPVSQDFMTKMQTELPQQKVSAYSVAALSYIHIKHMAAAIATCNGNAACMQQSMDNAKPEALIGFGGFDNHVARFSMPLRVFHDGAFVDIQ